MLRLFTNRSFQESPTRQIVNPLSLHKQVSSLSAVLTHKNSICPSSHMTLPLASKSMLQSVPRANIVRGINYRFSEGQSSQTTKEVKLREILHNFSHKTNTYNFQTLLKMYRILLTNNIPVSQQDLEEFEHRAGIQLQKSSHSEVNEILKVLLQTHQTYKKNKVFRSANMKMLKWTQKFEVGQAFRTLLLMLELGFPLPTVSRVLYKMAHKKENQKSILEQMGILEQFKTAYLCLKFRKVDLEIKQMILEQVAKLTPKSPLETVYFLAVFRLSAQALEETVRYESRKKSLYQVAFNPYRDIELETTEFEKKQADSKHASENSQQPNYSLETEKEAEVDKKILEQLLSVKQHLLTEITKAINTEKLQSSVDQILREVVEDQTEDEVPFKDKTQIIRILIEVESPTDGSSRRELICRLIIQILERSLVQEQKSVSKDFISLGEFVGMVKVLSKENFTVLRKKNFLQSEETTTLKECFKYWSLSKLIKS